MKKDKKISKKQPYLKAMTIRYDEEQELEIQELMNHAGEKTMSKALLKAPQILKNMMSLIKQHEETIDHLEAKGFEMEQIVQTFHSFNKKLESFVEKGENYVK